VLAPRLADRRDQARVHDEELRHRLGGPARLGGDHEERACELEPGEQRVDRAGVDVVEHVEPRVPVAGRVAERVPPRRSERAAKRDRAERGAADPEHHDVE
jgi:hypothetical protein